MCAYSVNIRHYAVNVNSNFTKKYFNKCVQVCSKKYFLPLEKHTGLCILGGKKFFFAVFFVHIYGRRTIDWFKIFKPYTDDIES